MKLFTSFFSGLALLFLPAVVAAQGLADGSDAGPFQDLLLDIMNITNTILIPFIIGIGFLVFVWGMFQYFIAGGANDEKKEAGKSLMVYATLGFVLIIIFWGVVNLVASSTGLEAEQFNDGALVPNDVPIGDA